LKPAELAASFDSMRPSPLTAPLRRRRIALLTSAAFAVVFFAMAAQAFGYYIEGRAWPGGTITYYSSAYPRAVDRAAAVWNRAGVGVTFQKAPRSTARVFVSSGPTGCGGRALVGYPGYAGSSWVKLDSGCNKDLIVLTTAHEFGHVIGLGHENNRCARMNPVLEPDGSPNHCAHHPLEYWLSHVLQKDDLAGARAIYTR
jgi:astacin (peptidase family M12A)